MSSKRALVTLTAALLGLALVSGCVTREDLDTLSANVAQRDRELAQRIDTTQQMVQETTNPVQANQANFMADLAGVQKRLAVIEGQLQEESRGAAPVMTRQQLTDQVMAIKFALKHQMGIDVAVRGEDPRFSLSAPNATALANATAQAAPAAPAVTVGPMEDKPETETQFAADPAQALYDRAMAAFTARNYAEAASLWSEFGDTFKGHQLVPNAYFWRGEAFFQQEKYAEAILSYEEVRAKYKQNAKYRPSVLKQGISFYKLGKKKAGQHVLNDLIRRYPDSPEAKRAQAFMQNN